MPAFRHLNLSNDPHFAEAVVPLCSQLVAINCRSTCHLVGPAKVSCSFSIGFIVRASWAVTCLQSPFEAEDVWPFEPGHPCPSRSCWTLPKVERESKTADRRRHGMSRIVARVTRAIYVMSAMGALLACGMMRAQNLDLEGGTGIFITPLAYAASSPAHGFGKPIVAYHFLDAGSVVGTFSNISVDEGAFGRLEFGYSRDVHCAGDNPELSPLWDDGFNILQGKVNIIRENAGGHNWILAISIGGVERTQVHNVGGVIANVDRNNGDAYVVASKTIVASWLHGVPIIATGGLRGTNAELWGFRGQRDKVSRTGIRLGGFPTQPGSTLVVLASEVAQQPAHPL